MMEGWKYVELGNICKIKGGKRLPKGHNLTEKVTSHPYIRARDIKEGKINFDQPVYVENGTFEKISRYIVNEGQVILTIAGTVAEVALVTNEFDKASLTENAVKIIVDETQISSIFLKFLCQSNHIKSYFELIASGAAQPKLGIYKIQSTKINLPPLPTQRKIASILSAYDDLIENNLKRIKLLEEKAQLTYEEWFVRMKFPGHETTPINQETGLPEGWEKKKCFDVMEVLSGGTPKTTTNEFWNGTIQFYTPKDAVVSAYTNGTEKKITELGLAKCNSKLYPKDTVFITARGTVGKINLASEPMAMNQSCYALKGKDTIKQIFLFNSIKNIVDSFKGAASGGVFDTIVVDTFRFLPFVKPANELINLFTDYAEPLYQSALNIQKQNQLLKEARDILLPRLMTGMIDVEQMNLENLQSTMA